MLDSLRGSQKPGIKGAHALVLLHNLLAFLKDAHDRIAGFSARGLIELGEDALKALDLRFARSITGSRPQRSKAQAERRRHA
jgi:hypothetical protein